MTDRANPACSLPQFLRRLGVAMSTAWLAVLAADAHAVERSWAVTVSVTDLVQPMLSLQAERAVTDKISVAVKTGYANYEPAHFAELTILTVSGRVGYALAGSFERGWRLLGDGEYGWSWMQGPNSIGSGERQRGALLLSGKWTGSAGVVVEAQIGYGVGSTEVRSIAGNQRFDQVLTYGPRGDLRLGYSF